MARLIHDRLVLHFPANQVFLDEYKIPIGVDFRDWLDQQIRGCDLVLAVIGPHWLRVRDARGARRLDAPGDYVRTEIEIALARRIPLIPILLDGATMPKEDELPDSIKRLAFIQAAAVNVRGQFGDDMQRLIRGIEWLFDHAESEIRAELPAPAPLVTNPAGGAARGDRQAAAGGTASKAEAPPDAGVRKPRSSASPRVKSRYVLAVLGALALLLAGFIAAPGLMARLDRARTEPAAPVAQAQQPAPTLATATAEIVPAAAPPLAASPPDQQVFRDRLKDGSQGPAMVRLPGGTFKMGSPEDEPERSSDEGPRHEVRVQPFAIGQTEVTFADYDRFAQATGRNKPDDEGWGRDSHPVINVSWDDATAYAAWLAKQTGQPYRLPSEAEWEYAARAGTQTPFWTGACINTDQANYNGNYPLDGCAKIAVSRKQTVPAGSLPPNPLGPP